MIYKKISRRSVSSLLPLSFHLCLTSPIFLRFSHLKEEIPSYPIVSRAKPYSKFRKSLSEFLDRLISSSSDAEVLYDDTMMEVFKAWVSAMSSSSIRSFRHTATVMALWTITSVSSVSEQAKKDLNSVVKQRDTEKKKGNRNDKARLKELEGKVLEARENKGS